MVVVGVGKGNQGPYHLYHIENPKSRQFSYCGHELSSRWSIVKLPDEDPERREVVCSVCRAAYVKERRR